MNNYLCLVELVMASQRRLSLKDFHDTFESSKKKMVKHKFHIEVYAKREKC